MEQKFVFYQLMCQSLSEREKGIGAEAGLPFKCAQNAAVSV